MLARLLGPLAGGIAPALRGGAMSGLLVVALSAALPVDRAAADEPDEVAAEVEHEAEGSEEHGDHAHGPFYTHTTFWAAVINFALLLFVLRKLGSKPLAEFLQERRRVMERSMTEAAELRAKAEALQTEYSARLAQLDADLQKLRDDIARAAEEDKARIVADAEETARRLRRETEGLIEQHAKALSLSVRRDVVEAATSAAEQILRGSLTDGDQQRLADGFKQGLASGAAKDAQTAAGGPKPAAPPLPPRPEGTP
jgi:F-type H+-transporting ATPase subunit b